MSLQNQETGQPAPPREQLNQMVGIRESQLENVLLKQTLAEYEQQLTLMQSEQNSFILTQSAKTDDLTKTVAGLVTANQLLAQNLADELSKLSSRLSEPLQSSYQRFTTKTETAEEQLSKQTEKYIQSIDSLIAQTEERKNRFFTFNRIKSIVFWSGWFSAIILLLMEVLRTLIMK